METVMEFMKLEKIEFGGIKGKMLSSQVVHIFEQFNDQYKVFTERSYDSLDPLDEVCFLKANIGVQGIFFRQSATKSGRPYGVTSASSLRTPPPPPPPPTG